MKKTTILVAFILTVFSTSIFSLPMFGTYNVGTGQFYTSLTNASGFFAAVNANGVSGNITVNITSDITETGANSLNQWTESPVGSTHTITIKPSSATLRTLSGNPTVPLINYNGCDRVTIDGRFSGAGQFLRFRNTQGKQPAFKFINDSQLDTIRYCIIESNNDSTSSGTIHFSTTTGTNGNDNNVISNCDIRDRSDAAGTPINAIFSAGTSSSSAKYNASNIISNNKIYNFYLSGANCQGVYLGDGNTDWTISGNSFYQTSTRTPAAATGCNVILIGSSSNTNVTISNNFIGGTAANCTGTPWTVSGTTANFMYGIRFSAAGTSAASNINGNTIANIDFTTTTVSNNIEEFSGILISAGLVNIGTTSGNAVGNNTTTGSIKLTVEGATTNIVLRGIDHRGSGNVSNNQVGSISIAGGSTGLVSFDALCYQSTPISSVTISANILGSSTIANSIQCTVPALDLIMTGINAYTFTSALTVSGNTVANLNNVSTDNNARVAGIIQNRTATSPTTIQSNTIFELTSAALNTSVRPNECAVVGIMNGSYDSTSMLISGNTVHGLHATGNADALLIGICHTELSSKGTVQRNKVYDLTNTTTSTGGAIYGLNAYWGNWNYYNNVVTITNGAATDNPVVGLPHKIKSRPAKIEFNQNNSVNGECSITLNDFNVLQQNPLKIDKPDMPQTDVAANGVLIEGIHDEAERGGFYYNNTIYIGGSATSGSINSYCYLRPFSAYPTPVTMFNNLFYNNRTGGTGLHYTVGNEISPAGKNWNPGNYNVFITSNSSTVTTWGAGNSLTVTQWRDSSGGDKQTWNTTTASIAATNLFTSVSTGDLSINSGNSVAWVVSGKGIALSSVTQDFNGTSRSSTIAGGTTDIGAYEFAATPPANPNAVVDFAPGSGVTSTYTLWGRTIAKIQWGTGGSAYPTAVNIKYYTGVKHPNAVTGAYGTSYWDVTTTGTLTGTTYDITWYFGDNETFSISTPSANTRLAEYIVPWEVYTVAGTGNYQSELSWGNLTVKTRGIPKISSFTLTDGTAPLPVSMLFFNALSSSRSVTLSWATSWEINNRGFEIERRKQSTPDVYTDWEKAGFVAGNGTTTEQKDYKYTDDKLVTGKYQYRLKQIDFNGNSEYYSLNNPNIVDIGKPSAFDLHQNYPNPSNPKTKIDFEIPFSAKVTIKVYDFLGQEVTTLVNESKDAGYYTSEFDGSNLASGVYFYRINVQGDAQNYNKTMKMLIVK